MPYYDWLERSKSSASVGRFFHILTFFIYQNIGSVLAPPPTSIIEKIRFGVLAELYFVLFINTYAPTQFIQDTATLFVHTSCVEVTERAVAPSQYKRFAFDHPVLT